MLMIPRGSRWVRVHRTLTHGVYVKPSDLSGLVHVEPSARLALVKLMGNVMSGLFCVRTLPEGFSA
jgi:hypothetical protein